MIIINPKKGNKYIYSNRKYQHSRNGEIVTVIKVDQTMKNCEIKFNDGRKEIVPRVNLFPLKK